MGNIDSKSTIEALRWVDEPDRVPEGSWLVTIWLCEIRGLPAGMSGDFGGYAVR